MCVCVCVCVCFSTVTVYILCFITRTSLNVVRVVDTWRGVLATRVLMQGGLNTQVILITKSEE